MEGHDGMAQSVVMQAFYSGIILHCLIGVIDELRLWHWITSLEWSTLVTNFVFLKFPTCHISNNINFFLHK